MEPAINECHQNGKHKSEEEMAMGPTDGPGDGLLTGRSESGPDRSSGGPPYPFLRPGADDSAPDDSSEASEVALNREFPGLKLWDVRNTHAEKGREIPNGHLMVTADSAQELVRIPRDQLFSAINEAESIDPDCELQLSLVNPAELESPVLRNKVFSLLQGLGINLNRRTVLDIPPRCHASFSKIDPPNIQWAYSFLRGKPKLGEAAVNYSAVEIGDSEGADLVHAYEGPSSALLQSSEITPEVVEFLKLYSLDNDGVIFLGDPSALEVPPDKLAMMWASLFKVYPERMHMRLKIPGSRIDRFNYSDNPQIFRQKLRDYRARIDLALTEILKDLRKNE